jgi:hypothetical protein
MKLGDVVHTIAQPIARGIDSALGTDIENCGGCAKRRASLNQLSDKVSEFFSKPKQERGNMQFNVVVIVEAKNAKEAVNKISDDAGEVAAVQPRTQPTTGQPRPVVTPALEKHPSTVPTATA